jgi:hypothetical protein
LIYSALDHTGFLLMLARLRLDDWLHGSTEAQRGQVDQGGDEQLREPFPEVDLGGPGARWDRSPPATSFGLQWLFVVERELSHSRTGAVRARLSAKGRDMKNASFYQRMADAMGVALYLYPDGSVTNLCKVGVEPAVTIEPHERWKPAADHGFGEQLRPIQPVWNRPTAS